MASVSYHHSDRLLMGSPLRRSSVCLVICAVLLAVLMLAALVHIGVLVSMRPDVAGIFFRALALSSVLAMVPLAVLWFLGPARARGGTFRARFGIERNGETLLAEDSYTRGSELVDGYPEMTLGVLSLAIRRRQVSNSD